MSDHSTELSAELPCHRCRYDLRAHPPDGTCPECGASVAEARRWAAIPRHPAWRDSDPRWRRRMLAGVWILVLLPLMDALTALAWTSRIPVPTVFDYRGTVNTLSDAFICSQDVYPPLAFCAGVALLFSRERARRDGRLQRARRWGIGCGYVVLLLNAVQILFISALVLVGIAAVFQSMPLKYQPVATQLFVDLSTTYLRYGPYPGEASVTVLAAFSSIVMLLACVPLFDVLRRSGPKLPAAILLAPLALLALISLVQIARYYLRASSSHW